MPGPQGSFFTGPLRNKEAKRSLRAWFANLPLDKDPDYIAYMNDFLVAQNYAAGDWTITNTGTPTIGLASNAVGGALSIVTDATTSAKTSSQQTQAVWKMAAGKRLWFECRAQLHVPAEPDFMIGLASVDTTPLDAADRAVFRVKASDASGLIYTETSASSSGSSDSSGVTAVADTYNTLSMYWDGISSLQMFIDRQLVKTYTAHTPAAQLKLTLYLGVVSETALIDYLFVAQER
jgi:hypothetical protein